MTRNDRIDGGLFGLLLGDAIGVPYEFHSPHALAPKHEIDRCHRPRPRHGHHRRHRRRAGRMKFGLAGIPEPWCAALRGQHWVRPLLDRLLFPIDKATP